MPAFLSASPPGRVSCLRIAALSLGTALMAALVIGIYTGVLWRDWRIDRGRTYRIGYNHNPPFQIHREGSGPTGFSVEAVQSSARRLGIVLEWVYDPSPRTERFRSGGTLHTFRRLT